MVSGVMQLTRMPNGPAWAATSCVSSAMPALAAAYGRGERGSARRPAAEPMVMIVPRRRSFIPGRKLFSVRKVASRLPSTVARHPSSGICSSGAGGVKLPPALATRMPTGPQASSIWRRTDSTWPKSVTSPVAAMALPPSRMIAAATLSAAAGRVHHRDGGAAAGELGGDGRPDAPRAAGYQGDLPVERAHPGSPEMGVRISMR